MNGLEQYQAQIGMMQQRSYCSHPHDPVEHAKQRLAELEASLANVPAWQAEADRLKRMIEAAK